MKDPIVNDLHVMQIDSFQKLRFLLFLDRHPDLAGTGQEFAEWLYLGDTQLVQDILNELQQVGLVERTGNGYKLRNEFPIRLSLRRLARAFEHPLTRQTLIDQVRLYPPFQSAWQKRLPLPPFD